MMPPILLYLLKMLLCSGILYGYYRVALYNERFHQWNRFYLLAAMATSMVVPLLHIPVIREGQSPVVVFVIEAIPEAIEFSSEPLLSWAWVLTVVSLGITTVLFIKLIAGLYQSVYKPLKYNETIMAPDLTIVITEKPTAPYSFFRWIFWRSDLSPETAEGKSILQHELTHIREMHSMDKIFVEVIVIIGWFNPFFWLMRKELYAIHEFLADQQAVEPGNSNAFAKMILHSLPVQNHSTLVSPFFSTQIKRRLHMITTSKQTKFSYLRRMLALVAMFSVCVLLMLKAEESYAQEKDFEKFLKDNPDKEELFNKMLNAPVVFENRIIPKDSLEVFFNGYKNQRLATTFLFEKEATKRLGKIGEKGAMLIWIIPPEKQYESGLDEIVVIGKKGSGIDKKTHTVKVSAREYGLPEKPMAEVLTIVNGKKVNKGFFQTINSMEIAEIRWLNPDDAVRKYGTEGTEGAQEVEMNMSYYPMTYINAPKMPRFAGGEEEWMGYLEQNLQYPPQAIKAKTEGIVMIECRVDVFGKLSHFKILKDPGNGLGEEALRLLKESPDWLPAQQGGKWVHARIKIPVSFTLK